MIRKNRNRGRYSFANINLLGKCNLDCFFCLGKDLEEEFLKYNSLDTPPSRLPNLAEFLALCKRQSVRNIYITGQNTDPLLYRHLDELIDYLQREGFMAGLRTNGLLAHRKIATINRCRKSVSYTMLTLNEETMQEITGVRKIPYFDYIFRNVTIPQRVATVVTTQNVDEILDLIMFVSQYPQIGYFQVRRISTDTREKEMMEHIEAFEKFYERVRKKFPQVDEFERSPILDIYGVKVSFWRTVETSVNSLNYFSNGVLSREYFIIEGYLKNKNAT